MGHSVRTGLIALWIAERLGLPLAVQRDLYFAAMVKDVGCSSNASQVYRLFGSDDRMTKAALVRVDMRNMLRAGLALFARTAPDQPWPVRARRIAEIARAAPREATRLVETRCDRGAQIAQDMGLGRLVAEGVRSLDEHWDGRGQPRGLSGEDIPLLSRLLSVGRTLEVFAMRDGAETAVDIVRSRSGRWFDPVLVQACQGIESQLVAWCAMDTQTLRDRIGDAEPGGAALLAGPQGMDRVALHFSRVVDAKSPFTAAHSQRVGDLGAEVARELGWTSAEIADVRRAGLLHDLGKLSVPNTILDKPGALTENEWYVMRQHAHYTERILGHIAGFERFAFEAAAHHERLDGRGYCRGIGGDEVPALARVLSVADVFDALTSSRPYRDALPREHVLELMERDRGIGFDPDCLDALLCVLGRADEDDAEDRLAA